MNGNGTASIEAGDDATDRLLIGKAAESLTADVLRAMLQEVQDQKNMKTWKEMNEVEQASTISRLRSAAETLVRRSVHIIAAKGLDKIDALVEGGSFKEGELQLKMKARVTPENLDIVSKHASSVQIVFATADEYAAGLYDVKAEPDQGTLIDEETGEIVSDKPVFDAADAAANGEAHA
ncbi:MAG: hypothetical protein AB7O04_10250 [Hyphomonadaceae bacterium]